MDVGDLLLRFRTDGEDGAIRALNAVDHKITDVDHSARSAGRGLGSMFSTAGGFVLGGVINAIGGSLFEVGKGILMANANAEQAKMSLETVMGSATAAEAKFKEIQAFAASTPFAFPELVESTINLEAFGLKSTEWMTTIGDTASAMGKSVDQVTQAVLDAQTGQYERLKELGIMASAEGDKIKFRYMKDGQEIIETVDKTNQQLINSTIQGIWNDKYQGAMAKQSQSFNGQWSTLKDNLSMTLMGMTGGIFSFATDGLGILNSVFTNGFVDTFDGILGPTITGFLTNIGTLTSGIAEAFGRGQGVTAIMENLPESWRPAANAIGRIADSLGDLLHAYQSGGFAEFFNVLGTELRTIGQAGIDLGEITIRATFKLASSIDWREIGQGVVDGITSIDWGTLITADSFNVGVTIGAAIRENVVRAIRALTWDNVVDGLKATLIAAVAVPGIFAGVAVQIASTLGGVIAGLVFGDDVNFGNVTEKIADGIRNNMTLDNFAAIGDAAVGGIASGIDTAVDATLSVSLEGVVSAILTPFATVGTWLIQAGSDLVGGMATGITDAVTATLDGAVSGVASAVISPFADTSGWLYDAGVSLVGGLAQGIRDAMPDLGGAIGAVQDAAGGIIDWIDPGSPSRRFLPVGQSITWALSAGMDSMLPSLNRSVAATNAALGFSASGAGFSLPSGSSATRAAANAKTLASAGAVHNYYVIQPGSYVGPSALREIESHIASGQAKRIDRGVSRGRLESAH